MVAPIARISYPTYDLIVKAIIQKDLNDDKMQFLMHLKGPDLRHMVKAYLEHLRTQYKYADKHDAQKYYMQLYEFIGEYNLEDLFE